MSRKDEDAASGSLGRWSRRKAAARRGVDPEAEAAPEPEIVAPEPEPEKTDAEILEELGLPDPDTLGKGDDFSAFMARAVPARLRRRALRRLWGSDPQLAALDGLVDYDDDYRAMAAAGGAVSTSYEVGRGFFGKAQEIAEKLADDEAETPPSVRLDDPAEAPAPEPAAEADSGEESEPAATSGEPEEAPAPPARPRRMTFAFEDPADEPSEAPDFGPSSSATRKSS